MRVGELGTTIVEPVSKAPMSGLTSRFTPPFPNFELSKGCPAFSTGEPLDTVKA